MAFVDRCQNQGNKLLEKFMNASRLMPTRNLFHHAVRRALEKEGWIITHDPLHLRVGTIDMYVDLGAEKVLAAERGDQKIAVEIKSFLRTSTITDFYLAIGQFIPYQAALEELDTERSLYLAVPTAVYKLFFEQAFIRKIIQRQQVRLLVYDSENEEISAWID